MLLIKVNEGESSEIKEIESAIDFGESRFGICIRP